MHPMEVLIYVLFTVSMTATCVESGSNIHNFLTKVPRKMKRRESDLVLIDEYPGGVGDIEATGGIIKRVSHKRIHTKPKQSMGATKYKQNFKTKPNSAAKKYKKRKPYYFSYEKPRAQRQGFIFGQYKTRHHKNAKPSAWISKYLSKAAKSRPVPIDTSHLNQPAGFGEPPEHLTIPTKASHEIKMNEEDLLNHDSSNVISSADWPAHYRQTQQLSMRDLFHILDEAEDLPQEDDSFDEPIALSGFKTTENKGKKKYCPKNSRKTVNQSWSAKQGNKHANVLVGGQYAEPPARYFLMPQATVFPGISDDDFKDRLSNYETFATVSPYVNYKNSNMAFSPQNLNDAFSIVDK